MSRFNNDRAGNLAYIIEIYSAQALRGDTSFAYMVRNPVEGLIRLHPEYSQRSHPYPVPAQTVNPEPGSLLTAPATLEDHITTVYRAWVREDMTELNKSAGNMLEFLEY